MFLQAKDGGPALGFVTAYTFKDAGTVMDHVRHHMHARVIPLYELAITPDITCDSRFLYVFRLAVFREHIGYAPSGDTNGMRTLQ